MFFPRISPEKCKQCDECIRICPTKVFEKDEQETAVANPADCIGCESCIAVCPEDAITLDEI